MKIFLGSSDTGGIIHILGEALKNKNHEVITASYDYIFQNYQYDYHPQNFLEEVTKNKLAKRIVLFLKKNAFRIYRALSEERKKSLLKNIDLYIYVWCPFLETDEKLLQFLKQNNIKVITLFLGSEVRNYKTFISKFDLKDKWTFPDEILESNNSEKLKKLKIHEKLSDAIFSVPDQSIEATRPYYHLFLPIPLKDLNYNPKSRKIPLIIHAPTDPYKKGTDVILKTIEELRNEGLKFHFLLIRNMRKHRLLKLLSIADILVDEIILHGPGFMSLEAMASGCLAMTKHYKESPKEFQPPLVSINEVNIKSELKYYIQNPNKRLEIITEARNYVEQHNSPDKIIEYYLNCLEGKITPQYLSQSV
jgi:glycosyltransferase involved in cell wall biosynthesis